MESPKMRDFWRVTMRNAGMRTENYAKTPAGSLHEICPIAETLLAKTGVILNPCPSSMVNGSRLLRICAVRWCIRLALVCVTTAVGAPAQMEKADLFEAGASGIQLYRIPGMVVTAKGVVLAYCEARKGSADWGEIEIYLRRSQDGGRTWEPARKIAHRGERLPRNPVALARNLGKPGDQTVNNPLAIADRSGAVHFLYCVEYQHCFYQRSDDDGANFSAPVEITSAAVGIRGTYDWKIIATGPGHGIQLRRGRLLAPVWLSTGEKVHHPSVVTTLFSDDSGRNWHTGGIAVPGTDEWPNPNESELVELADGRVMLNARNESAAHRRLVALSADGATEWSRPRFERDLLEPVCMGSIARFSTGRDGGKNRLLFANPDNLHRADGKPALGRDRKNLSVKLSYDEGVTWPMNKVLEPGGSAYSDLAVLRDGTILCFYERGGENAKPDASTGRLTLARFNLEWLTNGQDSP
ncbi:MAG TPA: sialidase family protein [Verrucomicrobiae bacterium]|nr:sialidase family protein [Verrucomicrobiae bacterium]